MDTYKQISENYYFENIQLRLKIIELETKLSEVEITKQINIKNSEINARNAEINMLFSRQVWVGLSA